MRGMSVSRISRALMLLFASWVSAAAGAAVFQVAQPDARYPIPRQVRYSFTVRNETNRPIPKGELWAHAPVRQTAAQKCLRVEASHPCELAVDDLGNQVLRFTFEQVPPLSAKVVTIRADLALSEAPNRPEPADPERFLAPEPLIEADHPEIVRLGRELTADTPRATAERIFDWVAGKVRYAGYLKEDRGALYALRNRKGDCTESMSLFAALCRASGIPARGIAGYVCGENAVLRPGDFHNWAEFWADGRWRIADPQRRVFETSRADYIALAVLSGSKDGAIPRGYRFQVLGDGLVARMGDGR